MLWAAVWVGTGLCPGEPLRAGDTGEQVCFGVQMRKGIDRGLYLLFSSGLTFYSLVPPPASPSGLAPVPLPLEQHSEAVRKLVSVPRPCDTLIYCPPLGCSLGASRPVLRAPYRKYCADLVHNPLDFDLHQHSI